MHYTATLCPNNMVTDEYWWIEWSDEIKTGVKLQRRGWHLCPCSLATRQRDTWGCKGVKHLLTISHFHMEWMTIIDVVSIRSIGVRLGILALVNMQHIRKLTSPRPKLVVQIWNHNPFTRSNPSVFSLKVWRGTQTFMHLIWHFHLIDFCPRRSQYNGLNWEALWLYVSTPQGLKQHNIFYSAFCTCILISHRFLNVLVAAYRI